MLRTREVAAWNALVDAVLQPPAPLPSARATDAARNLDAMLHATAPDNRMAVHALVRAAALIGPARLLPVLRGAVADLVRTLAASTYYADDGVLRQLGHER